MWMENLFEWNVQGKHVTALALNSTRKLVAFSEYGERPLLIVYDLGRVEQEERRPAEF
jgi:hypothetical protein